MNSDTQLQAENFPEAVRVNTGQLTILALLGTIAMLFAGFASAYLVRREGLDWLHLRLPSILWLNSAVLIASSMAIERARRFQRRGQVQQVKSWIGATAGLGLIFLTGQLVAWRQLVAQGVFLPTNPYSSFFYVLSGLHAAHLLGGIAALTYVLLRASHAETEGLTGDALGACALYWHFVDGLWLFVYGLLLFY